jgi:hypothetical protein
MVRNPVSAVDGLVALSAPLPLYFFQTILSICAIRFRIYPFRLRPEKRMSGLNGEIYVDHLQRMSNQDDRFLFLVFSASGFLTLKQAI